MARTSLSAGAALLLALAAPLTPPAAATHDDGAYDEPVNFEWHTFDIDVLVHLDPAGYAPTFESATRDMLEHWQAAIDHFGAPWLREGLNLRVYVPGRDVAPPAGFDVPDIVVTNVPGYVAVSAGAAPRCVATSTAFYHDYDEVWRVIAHEFGHCLGLDHVGDGVTSSTYHPGVDVMSYGPDEDLGCVSNLNIRTMERSFGALAGQPHGGTATVPIAEYAQLDCLHYAA